MRVHILPHGCRWTSESADWLGMWGDLFLFCRRPVSACKKKICGVALFCPAEEDFSPDFINIFSVFATMISRKLDGNALVTSCRLTHACARSRGAEREREKETQICAEMLNITGWKSKPHVGPLCPSVAAEITQDLYVWDDTSMLVLKI